jgi:hypothetical protein
MTLPSPGRFILEGFIKGCGLRRAELEQVRCGDISEDKQEQFWIHVAASESRPERDVPVYNDFIWAVIDALQGYSLGREYIAPTLEDAKQGRSPDELLFPLGIPLNLEIKPLRYQYARFLYFGTFVTLEVVSYPATFHEVAQQVKRAMGWKRLDPYLLLWRTQAKRCFLRNAEDAEMISAEEG